MSQSIDDRAMSKDGLTSICSERLPHPSENDSLSGDDPVTVVTINTGEDDDILQQDMMKSTDRAVTIMKLPGKRKLIEKTILDNVTGTARPGELMAIMGPSGSGKTSLLNVLGGRVFDYSGEVTLNRQPLSKSMKRRICYVLQSDLFFANLTVQETLTYAALLRLPRTLSWDEKKKKVDEVIELLSISKCRNTIMGNAMKRGISGGEKKRVNIGCELLTDPSVILLDEPTSGLDSSTAYNLMKTMKEIAALDNKTVITTIHQPASQIVKLFDRLMLLADGKCVYEGRADESIKYFESQGYPCDVHYNPADYFLEVLVEEKEGTEKLQRLWADKSATRIDSRKQRRTSSVAKGQGNNDRTKHLVKDREHEMDFSKNRWPIPWHEQLYILTMRSFKQSLSEILAPINFIQSILLAFVVGFLWFQMENDESTIADRYGLLFFIVVFWCFNPMILAINTYFVERVIVSKERAAGSYQVSAYFMAKSLSEAPLVLLMPTIYLIIVYPMTSLGDIGRFFITLLVLLLVALVAQSLGLALGATIHHPRNAIVTGSVAMLSMMLLAGFYAQESLPDWLSWARYLSFVYFAYGALARIEFMGELYTCTSPDKLSSFGDCSAGPITGEEVIDYLNLDIPTWANILCLLGYFFIFRAWAYLALKYKKHTKIVYETHNEEAKNAGKLLASYLRPGTGLELALVSDRMVYNWEHTIHFRAKHEKGPSNESDSGVKEANTETTTTTKKNHHNSTIGKRSEQYLNKIGGDESYHIKVTSTKVVMSSSTAAGHFYAIQTLRQLLPTNTLERFSTHTSSIDDDINSIVAPQFLIPCVYVHDSPEFPWRGSHIDLARHFVDVTNLKRFIDLMAFHKLNVLHLHMTDDQGWRFEVIRHPKLTSVGAVREETNGDGKKYDGYLTQAECAELVSYARKQHIHILPEIDIPGHATALLAAYPGIGTNRGASSRANVGTNWGLFATTIVPTEKALKFVEDVLNEVMDIFPFEYIHVGFDEINIEEWKTNEDAIKVAAQNGIPVEKLGLYMLRQINKFVLSRNRKLVGWDAIADFNGVVPGTTVMGWRDWKVLRAARAGLDVINTHRRFTYFDQYQSEFKLREPKALGGYLPLERVYKFSPIPDELEEKFHHHILGGQGQLWSECIPTWAHLMYMAYPRTCALAERLWNTKTTTGYEDFKDRLRIHLQRLKSLGVNYRTPDEL
eukprot:CFRG8613T1